MTAKIDTRYGSIWDELPAKTERKIPQTQQEAQDLYEAAQSSVHNSLIKTWDSHNDMMRKSAELRRIAQQKQAVERQAQQARDKQQEIFAQAAEEALKRREEIKASQRS